MLVGVLKLVREKADFVVHHIFKRGDAKFLHVHIPLKAQSRLDHCIRVALGVAHFVGHLLGFHNVVVCFQVQHYLLAHFKSILANIQLSRRAQGTVRI